MEETALTIFREDVSIVTSDIISSCRTTESEKGNHQDVPMEICRQSAVGKKNLEGMNLESLTRKR